MQGTRNESVSKIQYGSRTPVNYQFLLACTWLSPIILRYFLRPPLSIHISMASSPCSPRSSSWSTPFLCFNPRLTHLEVSIQICKSSVHRIHVSYRFPQILKSHSCPALRVFQACHTCFKCLQLPGKAVPGQRGTVTFPTKVHTK